MSLSYLYQRIRYSKLKSQFHTVKVSNNEILLVDNNTTSTVRNKYDSIEDGDEKELLTNQTQRDATSDTTTVPFSNREISAYILTPIFTFVTWGFISGLIFFLFISPKYPWFFFKLR